MTIRVAVVKMQHNAALYDTLQGHRRSDPVCRSGPTACISSFESSPTLDPSHVAVTSSLIHGPPSLKDQATSSSVGITRGPHTVSVAGSRSEVSDSLPLSSTSPFP